MPTKRRPRRRSPLSAQALGLKVIPPRLLFAGVVLAMPSMPTCWPLPASPTATCSAIAGFTHFTFAFVLPCCAYWTTMVSSWAGALLAVLTVSLLSHSLLDSITTGGERRRDGQAGQMNVFCAPAGDFQSAPFALRHITPYGHRVIISELLARGYRRRANGDIGWHRYGGDEKRAC